MQHRRPRLSKKAKTMLAGTVALAAAAGVTVAQAGEAGKKCGAFDTVTMGKYYVNNNLWGRTTARVPSASGTPRAPATPSDGA